MAIEVGNYISIVKLLVYWACFVGSLPLLSWVYRDAKAIGADAVLWTYGVLSAILFGSFLWWVIPIYAIGLVLYVLAIGTIGIFYVREHNRHAMPFDRLLTAEHIKRVILRRSDEKEGLSEFVFVSKNNNPVPTPTPKTADFYGYRIAYDTISEALRRRVASMTFTIAANGLAISYEIDGVSAKEPAIPREQLEHFMRFIKLLADLDIKERRKPQKGLFRIWKGKEVIEWEVKTAGSTTSEQMQIRRIFKDTVMRLSELGLTSDQMAALQDIGKRKHGIFIVSGLPGSGVTTTFYAFLSEHDAYINNIQTLEKEISAKLPSVTQEVYSLADTAASGYASKLEEMIRLGADVIGVAQCRDQQTARVICHAAKEAKMLYVVIGADNAVAALGTWIKLVGDRKAALADLTGLTCQRLVRKLCENCKQAYTPNQEILKKFNLPADKVKALYKASGLVYDKKGRESTCQSCQGTGFVGRTGIFELVMLNEDLKKSIVACEGLADISLALRRAGMLNIQEQGLRKVLQGITAIQELVRGITPAQKADRPGPAAASRGKSAGQ